MSDPSTYESAGGASQGVLTPSPGAGRRPDPPPRTPTLASALVAALGEMCDVPKTHTAKVEMRGGGTYSYSYADLSDVIAVVRPVLARWGLGVVQDVTVDDDRVRVTTILIHVSGDRMLFGPIGLPTGSTPQAVGSAVTYARRYGLLAALGVAADDDDDGQRAVSPPAHRPPAGQGAATPGGVSPSPSGDTPTGPVPWHVDPPDPLHAEQLDDWLVRLNRLPDGPLKDELRQAAKQAGWTARYALTGAVANAVLDVWEARLDDVEALEQSQQLPMPDPPSQDPYERWTAPRLRAELGRRGVDAGPSMRKVELIAALYQLDADRDE